MGNNYFIHIFFAGILVTKIFLPEDAYQHFMSLSVAIRILCDQELCNDWNEFADQLCKYFVTNYAQFYGAHNITYNVHNLIHLSTDVRNHGTLDQFSAFPFENEMQNIKKKVNPNENSLQQLLNRTVEEYLWVPQKAKYDFKSNIAAEKETKKKDTVTSVQMENFTLGTNFKDNIYMLRDKSVIKVSKIQLVNKETIVTCQRFQNLESFFDTPCDLQKLGICVVDINNVGVEFKCGSDQIYRKIVKLPYITTRNCDKSVKDYAKYVLIPLLHH